MIDNKILGLLGLARKANKISFGTESVLDTIERKKSKLLILANDSSERTKRNFEEISCKNNIPIKTFSTIVELSKIIGQNNKAIISVNDINFSNEILKIINGGENIG